jgi:hypothetical protein
MKIKLKKKRFSKERLFFYEKKALAKKGFSGLG